MRGERWAAPLRTLLSGAVFIAVAGCGGPDPLFEIEHADPEEGRVLVQAFGCTACHYVPEVNTGWVGIGPPLTRFAERHYIAGALPNTPENLILWIMNPQAVEPVTAMPDLGVNEQEARHMAAYLYTLYEELPPGPVDSVLVRRALLKDSVESPPFEAERGRP